MSFLFINQLRELLKPIFYTFISAVFVWCSYSKACNPKQNCMKAIDLPCGTLNNPLRKCRKEYEDTLCAAARKVCQFNCTNINKDSSNYIIQYNAEINRINSENVVIRSSIQSEELHKSNYDHYRIEMNKIINDLKFSLNLIESLIENQAKLQSAIDENKFENNDLDSIINSSSSTQSPELALFSDLLKRAKAYSSNIELFFDSTKVIEILSFINIFFKNELEKINLEEARTIQSYNNIDFNVSRSKERLELKLSEIVQLQSKISGQEARKCTPW